MVILWVKEKGQKKYVEGYECKNTAEAAEKAKKHFSHCDYKIEK